MTDLPAGSPRTRGRYPKGVARRQEILDKTIQVFARRGAQETSLRAIAREIGVTHAALTHYFGSLEELLVEVYRASQQEPNIERQASSTTSPAMAMSQSAEANRDIPGLVQLYTNLVAMALEDNHPIAQKFITERFAQLREDIAEDILGLQDAGTVRADLDPSLVAALVIAASDGLQVQWLLDSEVNHEVALKMLDRLLREVPPTDERRSHDRSSES